MAQKRYITIPKDEKLEDETVEFVKAVIEPLLDDNRWGTSRKAGRAAIRVEDAFEGLGAGDIAELSEDDWQILREAAESPQFGNPQRPSGYRPGMLRKLERWGWLDAITEASKQDPRDEVADKRKKAAGKK